MQEHEQGQEQGQEQEQALAAPNHAVQDHAGETSNLYIPLIDDGREHEVEAVILSVSSKAPAAMKQQ